MHRNRFARQNRGHPFSFRRLKEEPFTRPISSEKAMFADREERMCRWSSTPPILIGWHAKFFRIPAIWCTVSHIIVTSSGRRRISWLFFKAVRAGLAVAKRPYLREPGGGGTEKQPTGRGPGGLR